MEVEMQGPDPNTGGGGQEQGHQVRRCCAAFCDAVKKVKAWLNNGAGPAAFLVSAIFIWLPIILALVDDHDEEYVLARQSGLIALLGQLVGTVFTVIQCVGSSRKVRDPGPYFTVVVVLWVICMIFSGVTAKLYAHPGSTSAPAAAAPTADGGGGAQQMLSALLSNQSDRYNAFVALLAASNSAYVGMYSMLCTTAVAHEAEKLGRERMQTLLRPDALGAAAPEVHNPEPAPAN